jgi:hypothetical protein
VWTNGSINPRDAVSLAAKFSAHLTGIAFRYDPLIPVMVDMYGVPPEIIESQRVEKARPLSEEVSERGA